MGAVILVAVILLVTGIAIWLLLGSLSQTVGGSLKVSSVVATPMSFSEFYVGDEKLTGAPDGTQELKDVFIFDSAQNDRKGRVTCDGKSWEKMAVTVRGKLNYADYLSGMSYILELPEGVIEAAKEGYLDISNYYNEKWEPKSVDVIVTENDKLKDVASGRELVKRMGSDNIFYLDFEFTIRLKWGEQFGGKNPSVYYDELDGGADVPDEEVMEILKHFAQLINGQSNERSKSFTLTVTATPNNQ